MQHSNGGTPDAWQPTPEQPWRPIPDATRPAAALPGTLGLSARIAPRYPQVLAAAPVAAVSTARSSV